MSWSTDGSVEGWTTNDNNQNYSFIFLFILDLVKMKPFWRASIFSNGWGTTQLAMKKWILYNKSTIINHTNYLILFITLYCMYLWFFRHFQQLLIPTPGYLGEKLTKVPHGQGSSENGRFVCGWSFGGSFRKKEDNDGSLEGVYLQRGAKWLLKGVTSPSFRV